MVEENIQVENQEVVVEEVQGEVLDERILEPVEVQEVPEEVHYDKHVTIKGTVNGYGWDQGAEELFVTFCKFNTTIGEETYSTTIGITDNHNPIAVISYNAEINEEVINFIVNHIMMVTCEQTHQNDSLFYNQEDGMMNAGQYNPTAPVLEMIGVLHSWANIAHFESTKQEEPITETEVNVEEAVDVE